VGSQTWTREVFTRAFCGKDYPFDRVCYRLENGFSVLVYLPGNCMTAAAEVVRRKYTEVQWTELCRLTTRPKGDLQSAAASQGKPVSELLKTSTNLFDAIVGWLTGGGLPKPPRVIFHNLDLLSDGRGSVDSSDAAKTALFYLTETTRSGVVLGLSDRDAGELPAPVSRPFAEKIWLDEISVGGFFRLIPRKLGKILADPGGNIPEGAAWLLASRLRWIDPIRAVRIMNTAAGEARSLPEVLQSVMQSTRTVEFLNPDEIEVVDLDADTRNPTGFESRTVTLLQNAIIEPFRHWASFTGTQEQCQREIRRLPPGAVLWGPPGTGKSRLARWIAKTVNLPIRQVSAADLKRADWGLTERLVRELFRSARRAAPCVVVLDDADDLLPDRGSVQGAVASAERGIVNAFLQELQGFGGRLEGVLVILTTNRFGDLDQAAKDRLPIHLRIPYPLNEEQVHQIVLAVANSFGLILTDPIREQLVQQFLQPLSPISGELTEEDRRRLDGNLYSPRQIEAAMRLLIGPHGNRPEREDVEKMQRYFELAAEDSRRLSERSGRVQATFT
jgi:DNA polymerase III delta prime subunit